MKIEKKLIKDLKPAEYNPRQSTEKQENKLKQSLEKFGVVEPIIVNENEDRKNIIVGGHFRVRELKKLGYKEVDCVLVNLSIQDEKELNIRLNANTGQWDWDLLANEFEDFELTEWGLEIPQANLDEDEEKVEIEDEVVNTSTDIIISCNQDDLIDIINDIEEVKKKYKNFKLKIDESL
jgi:ParB-like chromosome segregation protein Spo0J